jgi:multidrug resistance efflux pump
MMTEQIDQIEAAVNEAQAGIAQAKAEIRRLEDSASGAILHLFGEDIGYFVTLNEAATILRRRRNAMQGRR